MHWFPDSMVVQVWQPIAAYIGRLEHFKLKKCARQSLQSAVGGHTQPDHPACRGQGGPVRQKGLIFRPILDFCFFKKPMSPQDTGRRL
jgi:hypothetical protein